jgi:hypothetical protein
MNNFFAIFGIVSTAIVSIWATLKYLVLGTYKIDNDTSKRLVELIQAESTFNWVLTGEHVVEPRYPDVYEAIVQLKGALLYISRGERLLTAGWKGKEELTHIIFPRWHRKRILEIIKRNSLDAPSIPVMALTPHGTDRLGELSINPDATPILEERVCGDIEQDVKKVIDGEKSKTGFLLYGPPGNGKTQFIKYLAKKYSLPIYVVYLNPDYNNLDIAIMFSSIPKRSLVLMEDFDNYFDGRSCIMKNDQVKFTFDAFINSLDGVHNDYKQVIFAMTANDIKKIDSSLSTRPSRFKFVREFGPPSEEVRKSILCDDDLVKMTKGLSLDAVFNYQTLSSTRHRRTKSRGSSGKATSKNSSRK